MHAEIIVHDQQATGIMGYGWDAGLETQEDARALAYYASCEVEKDAGLQFVGRFE